MESFLANLTGYVIPHIILDSSENFVKIDFQQFNEDNALIPIGKIARWKISFNVV